MPNNPLTMLLIERNDTSRKILLQQISLRFPGIEVATAATPAEALQLLGNKVPDIIICDVYLARDQRIEFACHMCTESDSLVIFITGDTDVNMDSFPTPIKEGCVQHVAYKPLDLQDLMRVIEETVDKIMARKERTTAR